jgi:hypothetical protein
MSFFYVVTVVSRCFKSRSGVAHRMRVESGWRCRQRMGLRGRCPGRRGITTGTLSHEPDALGIRSLHVRAVIGRPGASKSVFLPKIGLLLLNSNVTFRIQEESQATHAGQLQENMHI